MLFHRPGIMRGRNVFEILEDTIATVRYLFSASSPKVLLYFIIFLQQNAYTKALLKNTYTSIIFQYP